MFLLKVNEEQVHRGASSLHPSCPRPRAPCAHERERTPVSPLALLQGTEGRKLPLGQREHRGSDPGSGGVDPWEDAPNLLPHSEPSARRVLGRPWSWLSEERGTRCLRTSKTRKFSRGHEWKAGTDDVGGM